MSLLGALNTGRSALAAQQAALQVTSNNVANASDPNYTRQTANLSPASDQQLQPGIQIGTGVDLTGVQRQVDEALQSRLRGSNSDNQAANTTQQWLSRVESTFNELNGQGLSSQMSKFFNSWSDLANKPQDSGQRQVVIQNGDTVAQQFQSLRGQLSDLAVSVGTQIKTLAASANDLAQRVADLNGQIVISESGTSGQANSLRDQRDSALTQLAQLINIKTTQQPNGQVNVYCGSEPLVDGVNSAGVLMKQQTVNGQSVPTLVFASNNGTIAATSGQLGALQTVNGQIQNYLSQVNGQAHNLIFELNKIHASGQGTQGFTSVTATNAVTDPTRALTDPAAGLAFTPNNGSFVVHVKNKSTGLSTSTLVQVNLTGAPGDTTLASLTTSLNGIAGLTAANTGGRLSISAANSAVEISFSQDSSGTLAALGVNTFYAGKDASDIAVNSSISSNSNLMAAAKNGDKADNQTAVAISKLESQPVAALNGQSLKDNYQSIVNDLGTQAAAAKSDAQAAGAVLNTLQTQRAALSGVSMDEEAVNLMQQQRAFQAASRVISAVDEMLKIIVQLA